MAAVTQGKSDLISERNRAVVARLHMLGRPRNQQVGLGYRLAGPEGARYAAADEKTRAIMAEIVRLRDEKGWTWHQISDSIESRLCDYEGRELPDGIWRKRKWSFQKCHRTYAAFKRILQEEEPSHKRG
jgi:ethanolamine utilization microcompartment shell protein EutL